MSRRRIVDVAIIANPHARYANVRDFGAVGNGVVNDLAALQAAATFAKKNRKTLYIPEGDYYINNILHITTDTVCKGRIIIHNDEYAQVSIDRNNVNSKTLSAVGKSGLTKGSTKINGLTGHRGCTLLLISDAAYNGGIIAIRRWDPYQEYYYNRDVVQIVGDTGEIWPPLAHNYGSDTSKFAIEIWEDSAPITIDGLSIYTTGETHLDWVAFVVQRNNVTIKNAICYNAATTTSMYWALYVYFCVNVHIVNYRAHNFTNAYGLCTGSCSLVTIENYYGQNCGHALTGLYSRYVTIKGGYYDTELDNHWGGDYFIDGAVITTAGLSMCGYGDVYLTNCRFEKAESIAFYIRHDLPEMEGNIIIDNCTITGCGQEGYNSFAIFGYWSYAASITGEYPDMLRTMIKPTNVSITNVHVESLNPSVTQVYIYALPTQLDRMHTYYGYTNDSIDSFTYSGITSNTIKAIQESGVIGGYISG